MFDLDSKPDYFTSDDDEEEIKQEETPAVTEPDRTIRFTESASVNTPVVEPEQKPERRGSGRHILVWSLVVLALAFGISIWIRYFNPYETDIQEVGYITDMKRQGVFFKTWEGAMIVRDALNDSSRVYQRDCIFSVDDEALASHIVALKGSGTPVRLTFKRYWGVVPWRGSTTCIVTDIAPVTNR
jgi:hypothetical protein